MVRIREYLCTAVVIGRSHINAMGLVRSLGEAGVFPLFIQIGSKRGFVCHSKWLSGSIVLKGIEELIPLLLSGEVLESGRRALLYTSADTNASVLDNAYDQLKDKYILPNSLRSGAITVLMDKYEQYILASSLGLLTPCTWILNCSDTGSLPYLPDQAFPCITKSFRSISGGKSNVFICNNNEELRNILTDVSCPKLLVQKLIPKSTEVCCFGFVSQEGQIFIESGMVYQNHKKDSYGTRFKIVNKQWIEENLPIDFIKRFISETKYNSGLFSFEFVTDLEGSNYFTEMNFRNDAYSYGSTIAGCNLPYLLYENIIEKKAFSDLTYTVRSCSVVNDFQDFFDEVTLKRGSVLNWLKDLRNFDGYLFLNKRDLFPVFSFFFRYFFDFFKKAC